MERAGGGSRGGGGGKSWRGGRLNRCSTGISSGVSPAAQMGCLRSKRGSPSGADQPCGGKGHMVDGRDSAWRSRAPGPHAHGNTARQATDGLWIEAHGRQKHSNDPGNNQHNPQYANYWAPLTRKRHIPPHSAQPQHTNYWAPRTRKRHQQEHRPQRPTESSDATQHAKGRTGDCPGPRKETTTRRNVTRGVFLRGGCFVVKGGAGLLHRAGQGTAVRHIWPGPRRHIAACVHPPCRSVGSLFDQCFP